MALSKIGVVGSRSFNYYKLLCSYLDKYQPSVIVSGGAKGADSLAERYAKEHDIPTVIYKPEWNKYGKRAAYIRNKLIVENSDLIIAFWDGTSKGTKMIIDIAKKLCKEVIVVYVNSL